MLGGTVNILVKRIGENNQNGVINQAEVKVKDKEPQFYVCLAKNFENRYSLRDKNAFHVLYGNREI